MNFYSINLLNSMHCGGGGGTRKNKARTCQQWNLQSQATPRSYYILWFPQWLGLVLPKQREDI